MFERSLDARAFSDLLARVARRGTPADVSKSQPVLPADDVLRHLREAEERAAVSGRVSPDDLPGPRVSGKSRTSVLSQLAPVCVIEADSAKTTWLLRVERRTEILARLLGEGRLVGLLEHGQLPPTDDFGRMLRLLLRDGPPLAIDQVEDRDLLPLAAALEATTGLPIPKPDPEIVEARLGQRRLLAAYESLLAKGFVGRESALKALEAFVVRSRPSKRGWNGLLLTGLGGAGKSTLLVKFAHEVLSRSLATMCLLDYDRPGIDAGDTYWLAMEMSRQIGEQFPEAAPRLKELRRIVRSEEATTAERRRGSAMLLDLRRVLDECTPSSRPLVLILDTFEDVAQRGHAGSTIEWLDEVGEHLGRASRRPIVVLFSGRLFDKSLTELGKRGVKARIEIDELEPGCAHLLLSEHLGVPEPVANRLAYSDVLPRRPLELKLLARLFTQGLAQELNGLERDLRKGGPMSRELFAGIIYRRVLQRLHVPSDSLSPGVAALVRQLASPGLILRYVTVDVIQHVLAPVLQLPAVSDDEAKAALDQLGLHQWLTTRGRDGALWHRRDLRRSMLKIMIAEQPELALRIHETAASYFAKASSDRGRAEALYHRLMLMTVPERKDPPGLKELRRASEFIATHLEDLPSPAVALMRYASGAPLGAAEINLLPDSMREGAYHQTGQQCADAREFGNALQLFTTIDTARLPNALWSIGRLGHAAWEVDTLFATASWDLLDRFVASTLRPREIPTSVSQVFATAVTLPTEVPVNLLEEAIMLLRRSGSRGARTDSALDWGRLAMCVVLLTSGARTDVSQSTAALLLDLGRDSFRSLSERPAVARRLLLLTLMPRVDYRRDGTGPASPILSLSPLSLPLDPHRLVLISEFFASPEEGPNQSIEAVRALVEGEDRPRTVRGLLAAASTHRARSGTFIDASDLRRLDVEARRVLLTGTDPEFRDPVRFALLEAFGTEGLPELAELIQAVIPFTLDDLAPEAFAEAVAWDPEFALEKYVELVDRACALSALVDLAHRARPGAKKLPRVRDGYRHWLAAEGRALSSAV